MTINEIRLKNLEDIINDQYGGVRARLAEGMGIESTYLSRFYAEGPSKRNIGNRFARKIEETAGKPEGWLDVEHGVVSETRGTYSASKESTRDWDKFAVIFSAVVSALNEEGIDIDMGDMFEIADVFYDMDKESAPKRSTVIRLYEFRKRAAGGA